VEGRIEDFAGFEALDPAADGPLGALATHIYGSPTEQPAGERG
jgi:hypothetical protein